jgi:hypothetical protein
VAVIVVVPAPTAETTPLASMVATDGVLELQVNPEVTVCVEVRFALPKVPIAVYCEVWPTTNDWFAGEIVMKSSPCGAPHPLKINEATVSNEAHSNERLRIYISWRLRLADLFTLGQL